MTAVTGAPARRAAHGHQDSPLAATFAQFAPLADRIGVQLGLAPDEPGSWQNCADLLAEPSRFDEWRRNLAHWLAEQHPGPEGADPARIPERTTAGYVLAWYLTVPGFLGSLLFHAARRVPSLRPEDLAFRLNTTVADGRPHPDRIALLNGEFACLPDDPAASSPLATVVADEQALAALLRARFVAHAGRFLTAFGPTTRFGRRTLWAAATDALDVGAWLAGRTCGDESAGALDAALLLPERLAPFTSGSTLYAVSDDSGRTVWTRRRQSCCFKYALPGDGQACVTCPRVGDEERARRVLGD
ncbi:MAG TPA: (2Fe-2S)-binding protein [Pseudonocardiaceae bacterium]